MHNLPDFQKRIVTRSQGLYWGVFDAAFESALREFSQQAWERAEQIAAEKQDYVLMAFNELHQQLEEQGKALLFIPMMSGVYSLDFSIFLNSRGLDFNVFTSDRFARDSQNDIIVHLPSGRLSVAELHPQFSPAQSVLSIPAGHYRACCLNNREEEDKHAFLEDDYPPGDGPDFKFYLERHNA
jgi:hypothetical protein